MLSKNVKIRIYKIMILPVVLYGRETWSVTLKDEDVREEGAGENIWTKEG
jgi:hypothetical protein